eukprot:4705124-Karenia_brevis.AAC.1
MLEGLPKPVQIHGSQTDWTCIDDLNLEVPASSKDKAPIVDRQSSWLRTKMLEQRVADIAKRKSCHS